MLIRREAGGDYDAIGRVHRQAFDGDQEARLVDLLRKESVIITSLVAVVVGHPNYYPRFGFSHALVSTLENPFANGDAFMGVELARGSLSGLGPGRIVYPDVFDQL